MPPVSPRRLFRAPSVRIGSMTEKLPHRWFAFRLRTLLVVVVPLCAVLAWVGYSLNWIERRRAMLQTTDFHASGFRHGATIDPPGALWLLGERGINKLYCDGPPEKIAALHRLFPEAEVVEQVVP